jgi:hypothetical protein
MAFMYLNVEFTASEFFEQGDKVELTVISHEFNRTVIEITKKEET